MMPEILPDPLPAPDFFSPQVREARRFYLDLAPPARQPLAVVCGGFEQSAPDYAIDRASFPYCSLEFVARGKGVLVLAGQNVRLLPGTVFAYGPDVPHRITTERDEPLVLRDWHVAEAQRRDAELDANPDMPLTREELWKRVDELNG